LKKTFKKLEYIYPVIFLIMTCEFSCVVPKFCAEDKGCRPVRNVVIPYETASCQNPANYNLHCSLPSEPWPQLNKIYIIGIRKLYQHPKAKWLLIPWYRDFSEQMAGGQLSKNCKRSALLNPQECTIEHILHPKNLVRLTKYYI
jgi:hypothetical protein